MITLKKINVLNFAKQTSGIGVNKIVPILSYVVFEAYNGKGYLYKTNYSTYGCHSFDTDSEDCKVLLDEKILFTICNTMVTSEDFIQINLKENLEIQLTDGVNDISFCSAPVQDYPVFPAMLGESLLIGDDIISAIGSAKVYTHEKALGYTHVIVKNNYVGASNAAIFYYKEFDVKLPSLLLSREQCSLLQSLTEVSHQTNGNMDFFFTSDFIYGFTKIDVKPVDLQYVVKFFKKVGGYTVDKKQLQSFCDMVLAICDTDLAPICYITDGGDGFINLDYNNKMTRRSNKIVIPVQDKTAPISPFNFNPKQILPALRALNYNVIRMSHNPINKNAYEIWSDDDKGYTGMFSGISNV